MLVSIILPCRNEGINIYNTVRSMLTAKTSLPYEIIVVDDGSADACCDFLKLGGEPSLIKLITTANQGAARARNLGAAQARGEILVFCDAHVTVPDQWLDLLADALTQPRVDAVTPVIGSLENPKYIGFGQTWDNQLISRWLPPTAELTPVPLGPAGCLAITADVFHAVGEFEHDFRVWGFEDTELSLKLWLFGYRVYVTPFLKVLHLFRTAQPYQVTPYHYYYNMLRMAYLHFKPDRLQQVLNILKPHEHAAAVLADLTLGNILEQRESYFKRRVHDDDWFVFNFNILF